MYLCYSFRKIFLEFERVFEKVYTWKFIYLFDEIRCVTFAIKVDYFVARCLLVTFHFKENGTKIGLFLFEATCTICERTDFSWKSFVHLEKNGTLHQNLNHPVQVTKGLDRFLTRFIHFEKNGTLHQNLTIYF